MVYHSDLPGTAPDPVGLARQLAAKPLLSPKPQQPCDIGLFSDDANQLDLIEMLMEPVEDH
jgi:hypothetical protein